MVLRRHGVLRRAELAGMGCAVPADAVAAGGDWVADPAHWDALRERLAAEVARHAAERPGTPGLPLETVRLRLALPARELVTALAAPPLRLESGRVYGPPPGPEAPAAPGRAEPAGPPATDVPPPPSAIGEPPAPGEPPVPPGESSGPAGGSGPLPAPTGTGAEPGGSEPAWADAVARLRADLAADPFAAPAAERLAELGLTGDALAGAARAGEVLCLDGEVVLLPGADREALRILSELPQPFTPEQAGAALPASRRVAVALLRHLDGLGLTERRES